MNTGYNTDVRHNDVVFHVQTEDKGASNPFIESLVYVGGQVLASKRASYAELLAQGKDDKAVIALMDHQHRTMIAAIRIGKFDEKLLSLTTGRQTGRQGTVNPQTPGVPMSPMSPMSPISVGPMAVPADMQAPPAPPAALPAAPGLPAAPAVPAAPRITTSAPLPVLPATPTPVPSAIPPMPALSAPPVAVAAPAVAAQPAPAPPSPAAERPTGSVLAAARAPERSLDQVILEYLTSEADQEQLLLFLEGDAQLTLGQPAAVALRASSSKSGQPISGAQVSVKMISTAAEPRMLAAGRTDDEGALALAFEIPQLTRGTAALIITAVSVIGRAELKQLL
jgi:hypothetical protein